MSDAFRVAIVGSGPSGIFAAQSLVKQGEVPVEVDLYDRLPTPYGLLRYGVAPDHTSIKAVAERLAQVFDSPAVRFVGMVNFGSDVTRADLLGAYDAVIYAVGASEDRELSVPGEDLPGSRSARAFVAWYSGHPDADEQSLAGVRTAVTIGVGNVAVDVARILAKTAEHLSTTDMPEAVLKELAGGAIDDVWVVGRRGPQHASFTTPELRELLNLPSVQVVIHPGAFDGIDEEGLDRRTRANVEALRAASETLVPEARQRLHLLFWHRPVRVEGQGRVERVVLERTVASAGGDVVGTGEELVIACELVLRSIGYRALALPDVPFDERRHVIPHVDGRVTDLDGVVQPREYVVGWIKRGPIGVIGTNKSDAAETVGAVLGDLANGSRVRIESVEDLWRRRGLHPTTYSEWRTIEAAEVDLGETRGRARTKIEAWSELVDILTKGRGGGPPTPGEEN